MRVILTLLCLLCFGVKGADGQTSAEPRLPYLADGVIDTSDYENVGLKLAKDVKTITVFKAGATTDHYANQAVLAAFKGRLYCMWQSSPRDEDSDDTWVAYSVSTDIGNTWSKPQPLAMSNDDYYCTSGGWLVRGDTLIAFIDTWQKGLEPRGGMTNYIASTDGLTWSQMKPVTMADGRTKQCAGNLPDGTAFMVSCPANGKRRWPLVLQLSNDGEKFDQAILLRSGSPSDLPPRRYEGHYKTLGYSYPKAIIHRGNLYVSYSTNKEDVECTIIPLTSLR